MKDFISGSILEFKIPLDIGYGYCKILDFRSIREFDGVLAKVYDCIVKEPLEDIGTLREKDWLFGPRRMPWLPNTRGKGAWKFKGVLISKDDNIIPDFKTSPKLAPWIENESTIQDWYVVRNINEESEKPCHYETIRHLENTILTSQHGLEIRTAMEYLRITNKDIAEYFDLKQTANMIAYHNMINVPIYSTIPKHTRNRALC